MDQCTKCDEFFSNRGDKCLYFKSTTFKESVFESSTISSNYKIYSSEIIVDDQAYTIVKPLGKGGFGTVVKGLDSTDNRYYAMKLPLIFDETFSNNKANLEMDIEYSKKYLVNEIDTILKYMDDAFLYIYKKRMIGEIKIDFIFILITSRNIRRLI